MQLEFGSPVWAGGRYGKELNRPVSCVEFLGFGMSVLEPLTGKSEVFAPSWKGQVEPMR